ncbi:type II secretion system F family protein [Spongisporangium articulatum]|uniref:Type II secretion system F family protein n=1 Tax=Spongisporangium articulatum TaxID=3362603 RepID=A0ABW8AKN5_9ACTN
MTAVLLAGAVAGLGVLLLVLVLQPPATRGASAAGALAGLDRARRELLDDGAAHHPTGARTAPAERLGRRIARSLAESGVSLPWRLRSDLALTGRPVETHLAASLVGAVAGAAVALLALTPLVVVLTELPLTTPLWGAVLGALVGGLLPTARVMSRAGARRRDFRHVVGSFLDLVALNLSGGRGVPEALNSAAAVSDGWVMLRLRETLEAARWRGVTQWTALGELGEETGIPQLRDLAAALELVADDGAKVRESLTARAASLRRSELADAEGRAQARSQSMLVAQLLLAVGFLIFLIYPAITRVLTA